MDTFPGEKVLLEGDNGTLRLTSHRIRLDLQGGGHSRLVSITLDAVASCGLVTRSQPWLLVLTILLGIVGALLLVRNDTSGIVLFVLAIGAAIAYFLTRSAVLEIASAAERISIGMKAKRAEVIAFIDAVENAKLAFLERRAANTQSLPRAS
jgi:hypothetical protein